MTAMPSMPVPYQVRTPDGELSFGSLEEVKQAFVLGLIEPEDEVQKKGETLWRKAGVIPLLATAARERARSNRANDNRWRIAGLLTAGLGALYFLTRGQLMIGGVLAAVETVIMIRTSLKAFTIRR